MPLSPVLLSFSPGCGGGAAPGVTPEKRTTLPRNDPALRVNALATFSLRWLMPRLAEFRARHPGIEVRLTTSNDAVDALQEP
jgi:DNA-binding transcriptional LysR family regulator